MKIDLGDDEGGFDHFDKPKAKQGKKKLTAEELKEQARKKREEEEAKLPTKGKPSEFFILDVDYESNDDPTGQQRVPTQEQKMFIFQHYPTCAQPTLMISKIYELYFFAKDKED